MHQLKNRMCCATTPAQEKIILFTADKFGVPVNSAARERIGGHGGYFSGYTGYDEVTGLQGFSSGGIGNIIIQFDEFILRMMGQLEKPVRVSKLGAFAVTYEPSGDIKVGCTPVTYQQIKDVYEEATSRKNNKK